MISPSNSQIPDELLSAYIDDAVTPQERLLVEAAMKNDPDVAGRLEALQQTIHLLNQLPAVRLPRSFVLDHGMVAEKSESASAKVSPTVAALHPRTKQGKPSQRDGSSFWQRWTEFWQGGNLLLRNAATVSFALFLILVGGDILFAPKNPAPSAPVAILATEATEMQLALAPTATNAERNTVTPIPTVTEVQMTTPTTEPTGNMTAAPASNPAAEQGPLRIQSAEPGDLQPGEDSGSPFDSLDPQSVGEMSDMGVGGGGPSQVQPKQPSMPEPPASVEMTGNRANMTATALTSTQLLTDSAVISETIMASGAHPPITVEITTKITPTAELVVAVTTTSLITNSTAAVDTEQMRSSQRAGAESTSGGKQNRLPGLQFAQIVLILAAFLLGLLWWRSHALIS